MSGFVPTTAMMVLGVALLAAAVPAPENVKLHEQMTPEEIRQVFQTEPDAIPEYEEIPIMMPKQHKRAAGTQSHIQLNAFGRKIGLWLNPVEGILAGYDTPVYYARRDKNTAAGVRFDKIREPMTVVARMLEDKNNKATLVIKQAANGKHIVSGTVGSTKLTIRPLPNRFNHRNFGRLQRSVDYYNLENATIGEYYEHNRHVIYKTPAPPAGTKYASLPTDAVFLDSNSSRSKRAARIPSIMYPELLVVVDHASFRRHNGDTNALLEYLLPFWNSVDLAYRSLENPKIRFNIAGIIIEADPDTLSYLRDNKVAADRFDIHAALEASGVFERVIKSMLPLNSFDIMVTMSPYEMCKRSKSECPTGILGLAYVGGTCLESHDPRIGSLSVAMIQDKAGFDGVYTAAHELGHLFGARHDNEPDVPCSSEPGHIMEASPELSENSADWSKCTLNNFDIFFRERPPVCLFNTPKSKSPIRRFLPGILQSMDDQCTKIMGTKSCAKSQLFPQNVLAKYAKEICLKLRCFDESGDYCKEMHNAPADGSICGEGMICLHAKCIRETDITW